MMVEVRIAVGLNGRKTTGKRQNCSFKDPGHVLCLDLDGSYMGLCT